MTAPTDHGWAHHNRATHHSRAEYKRINHDDPAHHNRANQHRSVDDHAGGHDQHRAHHHRTDHDWAGNDETGLATTTTTGPAFLAGSQPAGVSAATVGALLPILGLLYLLRGLFPQAGGTHARRRRPNQPRRRG